jgi:hypothetical protein
LKGGQILAHCSSILEVQKTFVAFNLALPTALPTSQKMFNSIKKWG